MAIWPSRPARIAAPDVGRLMSRAASAVDAAPDRVRPFHADPLVASPEQDPR